MFVSRLDRIAPVTPVHRIYKDLPKYQPEFKKDKKKLDDAKKDAQDAFESILRAENLIKETSLANPHLSILENKTIELKKAIKAYKEVLYKVNDDLIDTRA